MSRQEKLDEIRTALGILRGFLEGMPDMALEQTWSGIKDFLMVDSALTSKTKFLVGLGAAAAIRCDY